MLCVNHARVNEAIRVHRSSESCTVMQHKGQVDDWQTSACVHDARHVSHRPSLNVPRVTRAFRVTQPETYVRKMYK
jgi:hypothetical protein